MALVLKDRIKESTVTTGTGTYTLSGAVTGFEAFSSVGDGNTTYYVCTDGTDFEVGIGTYTLSGTTLARTTILESSNSDSAVNWSAGTKTIFCSQPAEKAVFLNASDNLEIGGTAQINGTNGVTISTGAISIKNSGAQSYVDFYCESSNAHYARLLAPAHSAFAGNITLTLPATTQTLVGTAGAAFAGDVTFTGDNYNIVFDKSDDALEFADNAKAVFGAGDDLQIYHDGSKSIIHDNGTGQLKVQTSRFALNNAAGDEKLIEATENGAVELYHNNSKKLETTAEGVTITSTDDGAGEQPTLELFRDSASPADSDVLGNIKFSGDDSAGNKTQYAEIESRIVNTADGSENGRLTFRVNDDGSSTSVVDIAFDRVAFNENIYVASARKILFEGSGGDDANETTLTVTNPTADRTITLPDTTGTVLLTDGSGASLTSLNASELSSGTVPNARLDAQLQDVAGLAVTNGGFIVGDGSNFVLETGATARTSLGLGTAAIENTGVSGNDIPKFSSAGVSDDDFLRIDGTRVEGRSASEVLSDIGATTAAAAADEATALAIALG